MFKTLQTRCQDGDNKFAVATIAPGFIPSKIYRFRVRVRVAIWFVLGLGLELKGYRVFQ